MNTLGLMVEMLPMSHASPIDVAAISVLEEHDGTFAVRVLYKQGGEGGWGYENVEDAKAAADRLREAVNNLYVPQFFVSP